MSEHSQNNTVVFLMGPTASGKTALAEELYKKLNCELISVDSAQVYRGLDIGTAKPTAEELKETPHHLIDICEPDEPYSASKFCLDAHPLIHNALKNGRTPVLVGGTMLYFKALRDGLADLPKADDDIRQVIVNEADEKGWPYMHQQLQLIDVDSAERIKSTDSQRIQRALEVYRISGKTLSQYFKEQIISPLTSPILSLAIVPKDRELMRQRIADRFDLMLERGFIKEVEGLFNQKGLSAELPALKSVGYRQIYQYLSGDYDLEMMREKAITASRQLAKRQMTWLRKWPDLHVLESDNPDNFTIAKKLLAESSKV